MTSRTQRFIVKTHPTMSGLVTLFVKSPDTFSERRYDLQLHISHLKVSLISSTYHTISHLFSQEKLQLITGIPVENQQLAIYNNDTEAQPVRVLDDDQRPLGFYSPADFQLLKVRVRTFIPDGLIRYLISPGGGHQPINDLNGPAHGSHRGRKI